MQAAKMLVARKVEIDFQLKAILSDNGEREN